MKGVLRAVAGLSLAVTSLAATVQTFSVDGLSLQYAQVANGSNTDLRMRLAAPTTPGWGAIAIGSEMAGSLFFVLYPSTDMTKTTVSVRTAPREVMPTPIEGISYRVMNSSIANGMMMADVVCYGCTTWNGGSLNTMATQQDFIYAMGPGQAVADGDSNSAIIRKHNRRGFFNINTADSQFTAAEAPMTPFIPVGAAAPAGSSSSASSGSSGSSGSEDMDYTYMLVHIHAAMFCLVWLLIAPAALWALRFASVRAHYILQILTVLLVVPAFAVAVVMSRRTPYSSFDTYHQKIGITVFAVTIVQFFFGALQHTIFKRQVSGNPLATTKTVDSGSDTQVEKATGSDGASSDNTAAVKKPAYLSIMAQGHMWFGRALMILGGLNAPFGFYLVSGDTPSYLKYAYAVGFAGLVTVIGSIIGVGVLGAVQKRKQAKQA